MSSYITNLEYELTRANAKSLKYGDGKAWDNVKRKNLAKLSPRGPMFKKMLLENMNFSFRRFHERRLHFKNKGL